MSGEPCLFEVKAEDTRRLSLDEWQKLYGIDEGSVVKKPENVVIEGKTVKIK